jgi:hypothetical protein
VGILQGLMAVGEEKMTYHTETFRGELKEGETLDTLYEKFNLYHPDDFTGHSMSVSDVIVIEKEHEKTAVNAPPFFLGFLSWL